MIFKVASFFVNTPQKKESKSLTCSLFFNKIPVLTDRDTSHDRGMKSLRDEIRLRRDGRTDFISSAGPKTRRAPKRGKHPRVQVGYSEIAKPMPPPPHPSPAQLRFR